MRLPLTLLVFFYCFAGFGQQKIRQNLSSITYHLVAKNNRHTWEYYEGAPLKIFYTDSGRVIKMTGRLFIDSADKIQLQHRRGKIVQFINPGAIVSIHKWKGPVLVAGSVLGGIGAIAAWAAFSTTDLGLVGLGLVAFAGIDGFLIATGLTATFINGWLSVRSQKKGYYYSIEADNKSR